MRSDLNMSVTALSDGRIWLTAVICLVYAYLRPVLAVLCICGGEAEGSLPEHPLCKGEQLVQISISAPVTRA